MIFVRGGVGIGAEGGIDEPEEQGGDEEEEEFDQGVMGVHGTLFAGAELLLCSYNLFIRLE